MFIARIPETDAQKTLDNRMTDQLCKMYNKISEEGYFGFYSDYMTGKLEIDIHKMYFGVLNNDNTLTDFFKALKAFEEYYVLKEEKRYKPHIYSIEWLRKEGYLKSAS